MLRLLPADPVAMSLPPGATAADYARLRTDFGLDRPLPLQYLAWLGRTVHGDLGGSIFFRRPVAELLAHAVPATIELVAAGLLTGTALGIAGGLALFATSRKTKPKPVMPGLDPGTHERRAQSHAPPGNEALPIPTVGAATTTWIAGSSPAMTSLKRGIVQTTTLLLDLAITAIMSIPEFLWAILLILVLGVAAPWLPFIGRLDPTITLPPTRTGFLLLDSLLAGRTDAFGSALLHLLLPAAALGIGLAPLIARVLRASLAEAAEGEHVTQARRRGLPERRVLLAHILPNAALPTVALIGVQGGFMFGGTVLVETIFSYPGLGALMVDAVRNQDLPVIQAVALTYCVLVLVLNAAVDALYVALNPRLRSGPATA